MSERAPYPPVDGTQPCIDNPDLFFEPDTRNGKRANGAYVARAIAICQGCPFREACLRYALTHPEYGVWGGTSYQDRVRMTGQGSLKQPTHVSGHVARRQRIAELDDGTRSLREIARLVGCDFRTVRAQRARREAAGSDAARSDAA